MTRRAAIVPGGWTGLVVADDDAPPTLRVLHAESFEVGHLEQSQEIADRMHRIIGDTDLDLLVRRALQRFTDFGVESVVIEWASSKTAKSHPLAMALHEACKAQGIPSTYVKRWRLWNAIEHRAWTARRILEGYTGWPSDTFQASRDAGVMLLESISPERPKIDPPPRKEAAHAPSLESVDAPIEEAPEAPGETRTKKTKGAPGTREHAPGAPSEPRTAGIDPGSGYLGIVITEGTKVPVQLVHMVTMPVGERVPLKKPRKIQRGDETITLTTRHSLTAPMAKALASKVVALLVKHRVTRLAVEHVESVHLEPRNAQAASSIATSLIRTSWIDMLIGERAEAAGIEVSRVSASTWRARVAGRRKRGGAGAELIPEAVASRITGWPTESDAHERDAAGVNLWLVLPPPEAPPLAEKKPRASRAKKAPREDGGTRPPSYYVRLERLRKETAEARAVTGCTCGNRRRGRHRRECPLANQKASPSTTEVTKGI